MKKLFLGSVALVALGLGSSAALAAELRRPPPPAPPPAPVYTWTGCYIGANVGTSIGHSEHFTTAGSIVTGTPATALPAGVNITDRFDLSGFIGGGQLGCNWQAGVWVFGIEGDGAATNKEGQAFEAPLEPFAPGSSGVVSQTQERWLVTARARLGLTGWGWWGPNTLVYVTGGGAWAKIDVSEFQTAAFGGPANQFALRPPIGFQESYTRGGWTVGGGFEYALGYGWSAKGEFLYVKFDDFTAFNTGPFPSGTVAPREVRLEDYIWRAGLNYKFW
jgi:outer membrane immunogenic protein